ncbi:MAG TPA: hypothetical protein VK034_11575 [Enhygromyxa sp.]|nr:hypothetical protein [Enhygromyxa sp.]
MRWSGSVVASLSLLGSACQGPASPAEGGSQQESETGTPGDGDGEPGDGDGEPGDGDGEPGDGDGDDEQLEVVTISHQFESITLAPFQEDLPCISWTIDNEQPLYVQAVTLANTGGFHHSNGFVVPEDLYDGPDGVWNCNERGFDTVEAAVKGTVLFGQSTQSYVEVQRFNPRAVIKIPTRHRVVAELHMLNLSPSEIDTALRISLDLLHPKDVETILTPFAMQYTDLELPPLSESRFRAECDEYLLTANPNKSPFLMHWMLPHYHYLGNYFAVEVIGGSLDGMMLHEISGFSAEPVGKRFDPPLDLADAAGIRLTCGYDNWTDKIIGWGNGDQEMCILFGFVDFPVVTQASGISGAAIGEENGIPTFESDCFELVAPKPEGHGPPTQEEIDGELYLPPLDPDDRGLPPIPPCIDTPADAVASFEPTLTNVAANLFVPACSFSSCHGTGGGAGGLNLEGNLHTKLLGHTVAGNSNLPLIDPGNAEGSWLYQRISQCEPSDKDDNPITHMPLNAPFLLDPGLIATVRDWIDAGAPNN